MRKREFINELSSRLSNVPKEERDDIIEYYDELIEDTIDRTNKREEEVISSLGSIDSIVKRVANGSVEQPKAEHRIHYEENEFEESITNNRSRKEEEIIEDDDVEIVEEPVRPQQKKSRLNPPDYGKYKNQRYDDEYEEDVRPQPTTTSSQDSNATAIRVLIVVLTFPFWIGIVAGLFGCVIGFGCAGIGISAGGIAAIIAGALRISTSLAEGLFAMGVGSILFGVGLIITPSLIKLMVFLIKQIWKLIKWIVKGK